MLDYGFLLKVLNNLTTLWVPTSLAKDEVQNKNGYSVGYNCNEKFSSRKICWQNRFLNFWLIATIK